MSQSAPILILPGSLRSPSYTFSLAAAMGKYLETKQVPFHIWDLRVAPLPLHDPLYHHHPAEFPDDHVKRFVALAAATPSLVFISPIYHNGFSGVLKNAIDWLTIRHVQFKPIGLASHGGGRTTQAVEQLRVIVRGLNALAITAQVCTAGIDYQEKASEGIFEVSNPPILDRINRFCDELIVMSELMPEARNRLTK